MIQIRGQGQGPAQNELPLTPFMPFLREMWPLLSVSVLTPFVVRSFCLPNPRGDGRASRSRTQWSPLVFHLRMSKWTPRVLIGNGENGIAYISENNMPEMSQNLRTAINEIRLGFEGHENMDFIRQCGSIEPIFQPDSFVSENVVE